VRGLWALLVVVGSPLLAQERDCSRAVTQADMNECAYADFKAADRELNAAYAAAIATAQSWDADAQAGAEETLRAAQRAWIAFRDAACEAEAALWGGGSAESMMRSGCLRALTEERTEDLWAYAGS